MPQSQPFSQPTGETRVRHIFSLGDSLTAGYQLPLEYSYPSQLQNILVGRGYAVRVVNGGHSGDTSRQLLTRLEWTIRQSQTGDLAILVIGANDAFQGLPLDDIEETIQQIIDVLKNRGLVVVLGGMMINPNYGIEYASGFATIFPRLASLNDLPLIPFFLDNVAAVPELNLPDGIHPTKEGYAIIARQVADFLETNGLIDAE
ncbi:MAG: arylesterase [Candidatus Absconditabacterales bacterium]|nr:arylesterase [Candidatus Absconditabacterales bacterium]